MTVSDDTALPALGLRNPNTELGENYVRVPYYDKCFYNVSSTPPNTWMHCPYTNDGLNPLYWVPNGFNNVDGLNTTIKILGNFSFEATMFNSAAEQVTAVFDNEQGYLPTISEYGLYLCTLALHQKIMKYNKNSNGLTWGPLLYTCSTNITDTGALYGANNSTGTIMKYYPSSLPTHTYKIPLLLRVNIQ